VRFLNLLQWRKTILDINSQETQNRTQTIRDFGHPPLIRGDHPSSVIITKRMVVNSLPWFRDNRSVSSSRLKKPKKFLDPWRCDPIGCTEISERNCHNRLSNITEERWSQKTDNSVSQACIFCYHCSAEGTLKADSHIAYRDHAVPLPCSDSAVSFVKVRVVAGNIRNASPTV